MEIMYISYHTQENNKRNKGERRGKRLDKLSKYWYNIYSKVKEKSVFLELLKMNGRETIDGSSA